MNSSSPITWKSVLKGACVLCFLLVMAGSAAAQQNFRILAKFPIPHTEMGTGVTLNAALNLIYVSGGFNGSQNVYVLDGNTFELTATVPGSGVSVDSKIDNYWAGGVYTGSAFIYSAANKQIGTENPGYCPGAVSFDGNLRRMWVAAQCGPDNDPVFVYDADTFLPIAGPIFTGGTIQGEFEAVNPDTGRYYILDTIGPLRIDPVTFKVTPAAFGTTVAVNAVTGILYAYTTGLDGNDDLVIVDGTPDPEKILKTVSLNYPLSDMGINNAIQHLYISDPEGYAIDVRNLNGDKVTRFPLGDLNSPESIAVDSLRGRLYVIVNTNAGQFLYVIEDLSTVRVFNQLGSGPIGVGHK